MTPADSVFQRCARVAAFATPMLVVLAVGCWVISPRFSITGPSLIDDWYAISSAPTQLHQLLTLSYPVQTRFAPAWVVWNWIQWQVPGAPGDMLGPNIFGVARLALLVCGVTVCAASVVRADHHYRFQRAVLCALPALILVTVPGFAIDLSRFGPQEPALVGGMLLGGWLMVRGCLALAAAARVWRSPAIVAVASGLILWTYGVLQKETSVCALLLLVLAIPYGRSALSRLRRRDRSSTIAAVVVALALLPMLLMLYEDFRIVRRGQLVYGGHVQTGGGAVSTFVHGFGHMHSETHSRIGFALLAVVLVGLSASIIRRRFDWILFAILIVAFASFEMSFQSGAFTSRYYLPTFALLGIGAARVIGEVPPVPRYVLALVSFAVVLVSADGAHANARSWAQGDQLGDDLVTAVAADTRNGCNLTIAGVDVERSESIPYLVGLGHRSGGCSGVPRHLLLGPGETKTPAAECGTTAPRVLGEWRVGNAVPIQLYRC